jgi:hypothetical protein
MFTGPGGLSRQEAHDSITNTTSANLDPFNKKGASFSMFDFLNY